VTEEILKQFQPDVESLTLIPSDGGRFELEVNGELIFSKRQLGRHIETSEATRLIREYLKHHS
jgi:selenoprotein W-related protein